MVPSKLKSSEVAAGSRKLSVVVTLKISTIASTSP